MFFRPTNIFFSRIEFFQSGADPIYRGGLGRTDIF